MAIGFVIRWLARKTVAVHALFGECSMRLSGHFNAPRLKRRASRWTAYRFPTVSLQAGSRAVRKKKPVDPIRQAEKNRAHRIGWVIALAGIAVGFAVLLVK